MTFPSSGGFCVLDIETAPDDDALAMVDRTVRDGHGRSALHSVTAVSTLCFEVGPAGFAGFRLESLQTAASDEADVLVRLDARLRAVHDAGGGLITYNGRAHDLPMLARRACGHWLFRLFDLPAWSGPAPERHLDLMLTDAGGGAGRWFSLGDACAALGVPSRVETGRPLRELGAPAAKSQVDVVATFLLHLHGVAREARSAAPLLQGWSEMARHLVEPRVKSPHLMPFARHPWVAVARRLLGPDAGCVVDAA